MSKIIIKPGEPQPIPCPHCGCSGGYHFSDHLRVNYVTHFEPCGQQYHAEYAGEKGVHEGTTAFCDNCLEKLPFKLDRKTK